MLLIKRILFLLSLAILPLTTHAQFTAALDGTGGCYITGYTPNTVTSLTVPSSILGYPVTGINSGALWYMPNLTSVTLPDTVRYIGISAFLSDTALTTVNLGSGVTTIDNYAFESCSSLQTITLPSSMTTINLAAFDGCRALQSVTIPNSVTTLGSMAFDGCNALTSVTIGTGVSTIGDEAFEFCTTLPSVTIPSNVTSIGVSAFEFCNALSTVTFAPGSRLTTISTSAFSQCNVLQGVAIPNSVTTIGASAFNNDPDLASLSLGTGVTSIGDSAFNICFALTNVTIPNNVTSIGQRAFYDCNGITSLSLGTGLTSIGSEAFLDCSKVANVSIPASVTTIGAGAFAGMSGVHAFSVSPSNPDFSTSTGGVLFNKNQTSLIQYPSGLLGSYVIPSTVTSIADEAFYVVGLLTSVTIPNSVTSIGSLEFAFDISLTNVTIPTSVTTIGPSAFNFCTGLTSLTIPGSVTSIGATAFQYSGLTRITIPASVTSIGQEAFQYSSNLSNALFLGNAPTMGSSVFLNTKAGFNVSYLPNATGFQSPTWTDSAGDTYPASSSLLPQTITFPTLGVLPFPSAPVDLMASASSGLPVAFVYLSGPATLANGVLTITGVGTVSIQATQGGNSTYAAAPSITQNITVEPTQSVGDWATAHGISDLGAIPEHDGVPNLLKYLYHIDPTTTMTDGDQSALPKVGKDTTTTPGTTYLTLTYREYAGASGITVHVQSSSNLQSWATVTPDITMQTGTDPVTNDPIMSAEVKVTAATQFIRMNVTAP